MLEVWDDCFAPETLERIAAAGEERGFDYMSIRPRGSQSNVLEAVISSVLDELRDTSQHFEYWWRGDVRSIRVHRDLDEVLCRRGERYCCAGVQRCPLRAHVLYVDVSETK